MALNDPTFNTNEFMPHGMCFLWEPEVLWLHTMSDLLIALSYFSIPVTLLYFMRHGGKLPFKSVIVLFGAFILACGMTHLLSIWTIWQPAYYWEGFMKLFTALVSLITAIALWPLSRKAIALPNLFSLQHANEQLINEIKERKTMEQNISTRQAQLEATNQDLIKLNTLMTGREQRMIELKEEVNQLCRALGRPHPYKTTLTPTP